MLESIIIMQTLVQALECNNSLNIYQHSFCCILSYYQRLSMTGPFPRLSASPLNWKPWEFLVEFCNGSADRLQQVVISGSYSSQKSVCSGVPQGSVSEPLLFYYMYSLYLTAMCTTICIYANRCRNCMEGQLQESIMHIYVATQMYFWYLHMGSC